MKSDTDLTFDGGGRGKKPNQKLKPYFVMQYLLEATDQNHFVSAKNIAEHLKAFYEIDAEVRSVYRDIKEINKAMLMVEEKIDIYEATERLEDDIYDEEKFIVYDKSKKGFHVRRRHYDVEDIRLLAECIYSAKFLSKEQSEMLSDVVCKFVSEEEAKQIKHEAFLVDRVKTNNNSVINNITEINDAIHRGRKIKFNYLKYTISDIKQQVERRHGNKYTVSPFALLINDANYYLLGFEDKSQKMRTFRVDRMKNAECLNTPRDGEDEFSKIDLKSYTKRVFSMFNGKPERVQIRFILPLLDTVIERFGTKNARYIMEDSKHFSVMTDVEVSDQFYGWICGFGNKAKIMYPDRVIEDFKSYMIKIQNMY